MVENPSLFLTKCWPPEVQRGLRRKIARFTEPETGTENFSKKDSRDGEKKQLRKRSIIFILQALVKC
ncbi:hypothetical protein BpHYR1_030186 [Brachionus plicatilis]|uniref:Uncharacterized protein n=1 Tax=Brachionus plicatilis TaxID=10195 RepID=A0A3M7Q5G7_BRAPC|nr:hypothetical protein BpHYR1_030186 [Brachionus plicatilis]